MSYDITLIGNYTKDKIVTPREIKYVDGGGFNYGSPFGGFKQSGNGREGGKMGLEDFQEVKTLHFG